MPTNVKKIKKFTSYIQKFIFWASKLHYPYKKLNFNQFCFKLVTKPLARFMKQPSYKFVYNKLFSNNPEGYFEISNPNISIINNWIPQLTFKTIEVPFEKIKISVPIEYMTILNNRY